MNQSIKRDELNYQGVPFSLVYKEKTQDKPIVFFMHGYDSDRFIGPMGRETVLAEMGYTVILMDAFNHGERATEGFDSLSRYQRHLCIVEIVIRTAKDAIEVYEHLCKEKVISQYQKLAAYGVSMGAATAMYLATILPKLEVIVSLVGSPSFVDYYEHKRKEFDIDNTLLHVERTNRYKKIDPILNHRRFYGTKLFMAVGKKDEIVPMKFAKQLSEMISCVYKEYDTGHASTPEMLEDGYDFLKKHLCTS